MLRPKLSANGCRDMVCSMLLAGGVGQGIVSCEGIHDMIEAVGRAVPDARTRVMFVYLGRRGASRFALHLVRAALADNSMAVTIMVSRQNESYGAFSEFGDVHLAVDTFTSNAGAILQSWRIPIIRRRLSAAIQHHRPEVVIELMPHAWSSFIAPIIKAKGVRYVPIIHDAKSHSGDYRSRSIVWLIRRTIYQADRILTLSGAVAGRLAASGVPADRIFTLFHPDLDFGGRLVSEPPNFSEPLRLLFFGRIMAYKGLPIFLDMVDELRRRGIIVPDYRPSSAMSKPLESPKS